MTRTTLRFAGVLVLLASCGGGKFPPGRNVTVTSPAGTTVQAGNYEASTTLGQILHSEDGGFLFITVSSLLGSPDHTADGISVNVYDTTVGKAQPLKPGQVGWVVDPFAPSTRKVWANVAAGGTLTVNGYDGGSLQLRVDGAPMSSIPGLDGGATGTFTLGFDLDVQNLMDLK